MQHNLKNMRATLHAAQIAASFTDWLRADGHRLIAAADLLGGTPWRNHANAVVVAVIDGVPPINLVSEMSDLHRLLTLEFTDDFDSDEAALFFDIHPDDPRADEARLCAEALERGIAAIAMVSTSDVDNNGEAA